MVYDILALLWDEPSTLDEVATGLEERTGVRYPPDAVEEQLIRLRLDGHVCARSDGAPTTTIYALAARGSEELARYAGAETMNHAR